MSIALVLLMILVVLLLVLALVSDCLVLYLRGGLGSRPHPCVLLSIMSL